jgi:hypothetical protein
VSTVPNIGMPSLSRPCRNGLARTPSPNVLTRGVGVNIPGRPIPYCLYDTASNCGLIARPPRLISWIMATICGLETTAPIRAASATGRNRARLGRRTSHGSSTSATTIAASTDDSWSLSTAAPMTSPRITACRRPGVRRSRTDASRASGRNRAPSAMFRWYQVCWVSMQDRPKNAPAATAPVAERSHSRAARYIA